jgi:hypothetical protein
MSDNLKKPAKQVNRQAEESLKQYAQNHTAVILLHAKIIAYRSNSIEVLPSHVDEAIEVVNNSRKRRWSKDLVITVGGAFFGTFVQGFITELSNNSVNVYAVFIYVALGFLGMLMVFWETTR